MISLARFTDRYEGYLIACEVASKHTEAEYAMQAMTKLRTIKANLVEILDSKAESNYVRFYNGYSSIIDLLGTHSPYLIEQVKEALEANVPYVTIIMEDYVEDLEAYLVNQIMLHLMLPASLVE